MKQPSALTKPDIWLQLYTAAITGILASGAAPEERNARSAREFADLAMNALPDAIKEAI